MPTIIYLHGFASTGNSVKSVRLVEEFGTDSVHSPNLPIDPDDTFKVVSDIVHKVTVFPVIFVGTSLGGFWANYFAHRFDAPCVIVNPSTDPDFTMKSRIGADIKNYSTGEKIVITQEIVEKFKKYKEESSTLYNGALVNIFLAKDDDVIDYKNTLSTFTYFNSLSITEDGGHRYDDKWDHVISKIRNLIS